MALTAKESGVQRSKAFRNEIDHLLKLDDLDKIRRGSRELVSDMR